MANFRELKKKLQEGPPKKQSLDSGDEQFPEKEITGYSIEECIEKAKNLFQVPQQRLKYEIIEEGNKGFLGVGRKLYNIAFSVKSEEELKKDIAEGAIAEGDIAEEAIAEGDIAEGEALEEEKVVGPINGKAKMVMRITGAYLKATLPENGGEPITFDDVVNALVAKNFTHYDGKQIKEIVQNPSGDWVKIGEYTPNPEYDSKANVEISSNQMKAHITISSPILSGRILEQHEIEELLETEGIIYGVNKEKITEILEEETFNVPILVAAGEDPQNGTTGSIDFRFETDSDTIHLEQDDFGKVDFFSDLGLIQNVVAGQILAIKKSPTTGTNGKTVTGEVVEAKDGEDIPFEAGKNTTKSENGLEVIAQAAGRAVYHNDLIEVEPIFEVKGNVGLKTGSIVFLGDVIISESIEDGFSVKAAGNIYIGGTIGKADVEADGDIIVQRGILGKEEGSVKAGGNVIAKFIENSKVTSGNKIIANEGILHSYVDAKSVFALGKRGTITGGHIRTVDEINAKVIGSTTYTETKVEAGIDPIAKEKLVKFESEREAIEENLSKLNVNLTTMQNQKKSLGQLSPEREVMLERMVRAKKEFDAQLNEIILDIEELKSYLSSLSAQGKISANDKVYPGCEITIKNASLKVKSDYTHVTFIIDAGEVRASPYQEPRDKQVLAASAGKDKKRKR